MKKVLLFAVVSVLIVSISSATIYAQSQSEIPAWVKGVANFWVEGNISDTEFGESISFLIEQKIIQVEMPNTDDEFQDTSRIRDLVVENKKLEAENRKLKNEISILKNENREFKVTEKTKQVKEQAKNKPKGGGEKGGGKDGGTDTAPSPKPQCECYYNRDCFILNVCTDLGTCIVNTDGPSTKTIQDQMCRFFLFTLLDEGDNRNLSAKAVDNYLLAFETSAMKGISEPNENYLTAALDPKLPYDGHLAIQNIVHNVMIATVGPTEYAIEIPHRLGYYNLPDYIEYNFEIKKKNNLPTPEFGTLEQMDDPTIQALSITRNAIVAEIQEPNNGIFENQMNSLREIEGYGAFGRCEYPHPEEHGHVFPYEDGIDCLISEMGGMIHKFSDIGAPERAIPSHP